MRKIKKSPATHVFFGGSTYDGNNFSEIIKRIKQELDLPIFLFPGDYNQISEEADALLFLSLVSGRNPEYLIDQQIKAVEKLEQSSLEIIPTAYLLIESGIETAVERVSQTKPLQRNDLKTIQNTAKAGEFLGMKLVYLEGGSGAKIAVSKEIIEAVQQKINIPLIVGGGIKSAVEIENAFLAGANMVVIGTAFEENPNFFEIQ
ncbi:MAG: phosphoglycerol geranylgeranyltransferase [Flavobacterium haoranii]